MKTILTLAFLLWASIASAAPTLDTAGSLSTNGVNTLTISLTITGIDRYIIVGCGQATGGGSNITGVTWNTSENFTSLANFHDGDVKRLTLWRLINPTSGTHNVVVTADNTVLLNCGAISFTGVNQTVAEGTVATDFDLTATVGPLVDVTSANNETVVDVVYWSAIPGSAGGGQTEQISQVDTIGTARLTMSTKAGAAGVITMLWTDASTNWAQAGVSLKPVSAPSGTARRGVISQ